MVNSDQYEQLKAMGQGESSRILTPALCRAARGFVDWTQDQLAREAGVSRSTVRDYEGNRHGVHRATEAQLRFALEKAGVDFLTVENDRLAICASSDHVEERSYDASTTTGGRT